MKGSEPATERSKGAGDAASRAGDEISAWRAEVRAFLGAKTTELRELLAVLEAPACESPPQHPAPPPDRRPPRAPGARPADDAAEGACGQDGRLAALARRLQDQLRRSADRELPPRSAPTTDGRNGNQSD